MWCNILYIYNAVWYTLQNAVAFYEQAIPTNKTLLNEVEFYAGTSKGLYINSLPTTKMIKNVHKELEYYKTIHGQELWHYSALWKIQLVFF